MIHYKIIFPSTTEKVYRTMSPSSRDYRGHWLYLKQKRMSFRARACKDIGLLLLTTTPDGWDLQNYEVY